MIHYHHSGRIYLVDSSIEFGRSKPAISAHLDTCVSYECRAKGLKESTATEGKDFVWRYEWTPGVSPVWVECTEEEYNIAPDNLRRKVAVAPPVQPEKGYKDIKLCPHCDGSGFTNNGLNHDDEDYREQDCDTCDAKGYLPASPGKQEGEEPDLFAEHEKIADNPENHQDWAEFEQYFKDVKLIGDTTKTDVYFHWLTEVKGKEQPPSPQDSAEGKGEFLVLKFGHIYVDTNLLHKGIYEDERPVLFEKTETFDSFIQRHKDIQQYSGATDEQIAKVEENLRRCSFVPVVLAPPVSAQQIGDAFAAGVINAQRQKAGKDFITQEQYLASLPSLPSKGYTAGEVEGFAEFIRLERWEPAPEEFGKWYRKTGQKLERKSSSDLLTEYSKQLKDKA